MYRQFDSLSRLRSRIVVVVVITIAEVAYYFSAEELKICNS